MLALVGVVPAAVVGSLSFSVNRAEVERTVASAQARVAEEAARACERPRQRCAPFSPCAGRCWAESPRRS
ncbi:MAG: hypothetical protein E6J67_10505 [Deltaproteobacteria bacterium]|nr:MAG: hypothetical protein E6J67_10505 [Deltaproteobacteria bacterium]